MLSPRPSSASSISQMGKSPKRPERNTNFKVVIRVRPPLSRETSSHNIIAVDEQQQVITISENLEAVMDENGQISANPGPYITHSFVFDHVYDQRSSQKHVFDTTARTVVESSLQGYNATIFAYGQTGTGKTYTMEGFNRDGSSVESRGIIPRAIEQIFLHIQKYASPRVRFLVRGSYLQIYNETISDLLKPERSNLSIREDKKRGVFVEGLSEWVVRSPAEIYGLMERGGQVRATGETKMNEFSSRSHAVFIIIAEQSETVYVDDRGDELSPEEFQRFMHARGVHREQEMNRLEDHVKQSFRVGKLNLVDLAGSERVRLSGATGQRLEESKQINRSLSALGNVIAALTDAKGRQHIPYRDSKLTRMLEDSLGGNCKTTMMAMISPAIEAMVESLSTLKFANRAKNIKNEARINEDLDQKSLLRKYERELKILRAELDERSKNVVDKRRLLELDEQRKRAEEDKMTAIRALEQRSLEFMKEKEEKKKLEQRIAMLMGQMIRGERPQSLGEAGTSAPGASGTDIQMMKEQQDKLRTDYENRLAALEQERETIEEEKAQVDRYKQLLLKQRDIMIALTQRLVERDEQIMALQDELDAYDRHHKDLEEKLDEKTALLIKFQRISMEVNAKSPHKNEELNRALAEWSGNLEEHLIGGGGGRGALGSGDDAEHPWDESLVSDAGADPDSRDSGRRAGGNAAILLDAEFEGNQSPDPSAAGSAATMSMLLKEQRTRIAQLESQLQMAASQAQLAAAAPSKPPQAPVDNKQVAQLTSDNMKLLQRIRTLEAAAASAAATHNSPASTELQSRCNLLLKERDAVCTIMEQKIKVLVSNISQAVGMVLQGDYQQGRAGEHQHGPGQALSKDVAALQRLVNASVVALKSASASTNPPSTPAAGSMSGTPQTARSFVTSHTIAQDNQMMANSGGNYIQSQPSRKPPAPPSYSGGHNPLAHRPNF